MANGAYKTNLMVFRNKVVTCRWMVTDWHSMSPAAAVKFGIFKGRINDVKVWEGTEEIKSSTFDTELTHAISDRS